MRDSYENKAMGTVSGGFTYGWYDGNRRNLRECSKYYN